MVSKFPFFSRATGKNTTFANCTSTRPANTASYQIHQALLDLHRRILWLTEKAGKLKRQNFKDPFTHSIENTVIEAPSTFHRSFIEFFVVMHKYFDEVSMTAILNIFLKKMRKVYFIEKFDEKCFSQTFFKIEKKK